MKCVQLRLSAGGAPLTVKLPSENSESLPFLPDLIMNIASSNWLE